MSEGFEQYAIVELMGRSVLAGLVTEQVIGGSAFVRVDVPAANGIPAFTKFYGAGAIYCITPCDEATARAAVIGLRQKPISLYQLNLPARTFSQEDIEENEGTDDDETDDDETS